MYKLKFHKVDRVDDPIRIEVYCRGVFDELPSNKSVKKAVSSGCIRISGNKVSSAYFIQEGDFVELWDSEIRAPKPYNFNIKILYEDDDLAVVFKPAGLTTSGNSFRTLENAIQGKLTKSKKNPLNWPKPVHRLDSRTSGLVIVAKSIPARVELGKMLEQKKVKKTYCALLCGKLKEKIEVQFSLEGKIAQTKIFPIEFRQSLNNKYITKVFMQPVTGRTHQLRKHAALIKHPIIGDSEYGEKGNVLLHKGLFLCAIKVTFCHPITLVELTIETEPPKKFDAMMDREFKRFLKFKAD
ncbi:MAG: RNA pseudouridine synthase [Flavobacteriales bacterium]|nr:RNA pseudouridine synthase [Flavobacteriales bacterium]|tara:strand:+ start:1749 stop:2639 length:891 start_codon:yes stop_codon:yes gene_type:complete